jgi:hypothetical protein
VKSKYRTLLDVFKQIKQSSDVLEKEVWDEVGEEDKVASEVAQAGEQTLSWLT